MNTYLTDPARDSVVVSTRLVALTKGAKDYTLFVRLDANAGGNGGGGRRTAGAIPPSSTHRAGLPVPVSFDTNTTSQANRTAYAVPSYLALKADRPFRAVSSGFVGTASDGLVQLDSTHALGPVATMATDGNVEQTAGVRLDRDGRAHPRPRVRHEPGRRR